MVSIFDSHTYLIGCEHKTFAVVTVNTKDEFFDVSLMFEDKTVRWSYARGLVNISESEDVG
jgi:hypothetical protein